MYKKQTDLAIERCELHAKNGAVDGIEVSRRTVDSLQITCMRVSEQGARVCGKPRGTYITVEFDALLYKKEDTFAQAATELAQELRALLPARDGCVLAVGLGNEHITADSIGPRAVDRLLVTRHIRQLDRALYESAQFGELAAVAAGVLGQTGIESAEIIGSIVRQIKPRCVIAIDALASRRLSRLASTIQLSDTGICPGSGVANHRTAIDQTTLGIPVLSIGVPTVVDAGTVAHDLLEKFVSDAGITPQSEQFLDHFGKDVRNDFFVTPRDSDALADSASRLIAASINLAVHDGITLQELAELRGAM